MKVYKQQCLNCLLSPDSIVSPERRRDILAEAKETQSHFVCHKASMKGEDVCCSKWFEKFGNQSQLVRVAERLGVLKWVDQDDQEKLASWGEQQK